MIHITQGQSCVRSHVLENPSSAPAPHITLHHASITSTNRSQTVHQTKMCFMWKSRLNLLAELECVKFMPLDVAYEEYLGKLPEEYHPNYNIRNKARKEFVESLLGRNTGLPVLIVTNSHDKYLILYEECGKHHVSEQLQVLCEVLDLDVREKKQKITSISSEVLAVMELASNAKERAIVLSMLSLTYSHTDLRHTFGLNEDHLKRIKSHVLQYAEQLESTGTE